MNRMMIGSLAALALLGMSANAAVVEADDDHDDDREARPKARAQQKVQAERLPDRSQAPREKSASLKRMLGRKGRA